MWEFSLFQEEKGLGGQSAFSCACCVSRPLALNNPYVKEAYFGVTFWFPSITIKCFNGGFDFGQVFLPGRSTFHFSQDLDFRSCLWLPYF